MNTGLHSSSHNGLLKSASKLSGSSNEHVKKQHPQNNKIKKNGALKKEKQSKELDQELKDTFPASDPITKY